MCDPPLFKFSPGVFQIRRGPRIKGRTPAITAYQRALQLDAGCHRAHCHLAELYVRHGCAKDALRHYAAARRCRGKPRVE